MDEPKKTKFKPKSINEKIMDYLARRDHSERELAQKLSRRYEAKEIEKAIEDVKERGWLLEPSVLAGKVAKQLSNKEKGHRFIQGYLRQKGLPNTEKDASLEEEKARSFIERKLKKEPPYTFAEKQKAAPMLMRRGFDQDTIRKVLNEGRRS